MNNQNTSLSNKGMSTKEIGKKFLEELKAKGPTLDKVGKVFIKTSTAQSKGTHASKV